MASKTFKCRVVTPAASLADDEVVYASVPAWDGLLGVQVGRAPLLARLGVGELRLDYPEEKGAEGGSRWFALDGGFVRMADNQLIVLAERAVAAESFTLAEAEAELKSAATRQVLDPAETEQRRRDVDLAKLKVRLAREKRGI